MKKLVRDIALLLSLLTIDDAIGKAIPIPIPIPKSLPSVQATSSLISASSLPILYFNKNYKSSTVTDANDKRKPIVYETFSQPIILQGVIFLQTGTGQGTLINNTHAFDTKVYPNSDPPANGNDPPSGDPPPVNRIMVYAPVTFTENQHCGQPGVATVPKMKMADVQTTLSKILRMNGSGGKNDANRLIESIVFDSGKAKGKKKRRTKKAKGVNKRKNPRKNIDGK